MIRGSPAGEIGRPILFRALSRDRQPPPRSFYRAGAGTLFLDMGMHDFDAARWLMGDEVAEVHAYGSALVSADAAEFGDSDTGIANLRFAGGALGQVEELRQSVYGYDIQAEVVGSNGTIRIGNDPGTSALDRNCKAHELDNLYVVDASFFPSCGAVNPALTIMANALRVGDHLLERMSVSSSEYETNQKQARELAPA